MASETTERPAGDPTPPGGPASHKHSGWLWVSIGLAVVVVGVVVWALVTRSDLNDAQAELDKNAAAQTTAVAGFKQAYDEISAELGATQQSLSDAEQEVEASSAAADQAQQEAEAAREQAQAADDAAQAAEQERDQAVEAAESKAELVKSCAKAYASALGALFEGDSIQEQADVVRQQLQGIRADCSTALSGS